MNRIREAREAKGIPRLTLALLVGVSERTVERWEADPPTTPRPRQLRKLAKALGVSVDELGGGGESH